MKGLICVLVLSLNCISFSQSYPHLFELRGLEDSLGNTHLFYRYGYPQMSGCWAKSIYHLNVISGSDTFFIYDAASDPIGEGCDGQYVYDYDFFDNDPAKYIYGGFDFYIDPVALLIRYDGEIQINSFGGITEIEISELNDSLVYAALGGGLYRSIDGGYNFVFLDSITIIDHSLNSLSRNDDSQIYGIDDNKLVRSGDEGYSYTKVDDSQWDNNSELFYDSDGNHIYGVSNYYDYQIQSYSSKIYVSYDNGNPFSWLNVVIHNLLIKFTNDEYQSGEVYYSYQKDIYKSTDYANSFEHYRQLDRNITGLYKKSGADILYASTPLKIFEITPDTIQVIKSLTIPDEVFNFYPLSIGNYWYYEKFIIENGTTKFVGYETKHIVDKIIEQNGKKYFKMLITYSGSMTDSLFIRVDSLSGLMYAFDHGIGDELFFEDLLAEYGDTVCYEFNPAWTCQYVQLEEEFSVFELSTIKKVYEPEAPGWYFGHSLVKGIGLYKVWNGDTVPFWAILKGCIVDGVVYGDTTVVSVDDKTEPPFTFSLSQNFPNPFNPVTTIRFTIADFEFISLKVYDVLGNEITTLFNEEKPAGSYEVEFNNEGLPSGIYFYRLTAINYSETKKMILLK